MPTACRLPQTLGRRMNEPFELPPIRVPGHALAWARAHPSFFFPDGVVSSKSLVRQLIAGARALGA